MIFKFDFLGKFQACAGLFHNVPNYMGGLHLVLPGLNLYTLDAGILIMVRQERLMMFSGLHDFSVSPSPLFGLFWFEPGWIGLELGTKGN